MGLEDEDASARKTNPVLNSLSECAGRAIMRAAWLADIFHGERREVRKDAWLMPSSLHHRRTDMRQAIRQWHVESHPIPRAASR